MVSLNEPLKTFSSEQHDINRTAPSSPTTNRRREACQVYDIMASSSSVVPTTCNSKEALLVALRKPAATSYGLRQARQHHTDMRTKLNEATRAGRQTDRDLRDVSTILRRWPTDEATQPVSWTDEDGNRQTDVVLSEAETRQVENDLENQRLRQDDEIASLQRIVDSAQRNVEGAQRDFDADLQFQSNLSRMRHQTSMSIINNIGR